MDSHTIIPYLIDTIINCLVLLISGLILLMSWLVYYVLPVMYLFAPPILFYSIIFLILRYVLKVRNRILNAIITLIVSLLVASSLLRILSAVEFTVFILPWTDCNQFDFCDHSNHLPSVCASIYPVACRLIQIEEYILIFIAALVIVVPPAAEKIKKFMEKS